MAVKGRIQDLTLDLILDRVSEEEIFTHYLGSNISFKGLFRSPLRTDKRETCTFYRGSDGRLRMKDFAGYAGGGVADIVMFLYKLDYRAALQRIFDDFKLDGKLSNNLHNNRNFLNLEKSKKEEDSIIQTRRQLWTPVDKSYWRSFYINEKKLEKFETYSISHCWWVDKISGQIELKAIYHDKNPMYSYEFGNSKRKIYWPFQKEFRFRGNTNHLQGLNQLQDTGDLLVITKSLKDCMVYDMFGIPAVAPHGENHFIDKETLVKLQQKFTKLIFQYDNDGPGIIGANKLTEQYGIPNVIIPTESKCKDLSDYIKMYGPTQTEKLINKIII